MKKLLEFDWRLLILTNSKREFAASAF